VNMRDFVT
jgi:hypothetical protein